MRSWRACASFILKRCLESDFKRVLYFLPLPREAEARARAFRLPCSPARPSLEDPAFILPPRSPSRGAFGAAMCREPLQSCPSLLPQSASFAFASADIIIFWVIFTCVSKIMAAST